MKCYSHKTINTAYYLTIKGELEGRGGGLYNNREIKIHVYRKPHTSDSSREFLGIKLKQIRTVPHDSYG